MTTIKAYKSFDADWKCRGYQFEVGKTYTHDGVVKLCESGFHACEYPLGVFAYYPPTGHFAEVELDAAPANADAGDSKRVGASITIKASLTIPLLVAAAIEYTVTRCDPVKAKHSTGYSSASSATGDRSASSATGDSSASSATGLDAVAAAFGFYSKAKADERGIVIVAWWDEKSERKRVTVGYVDDGVERNTWYRCDESGRLVPA